MTYRPKVPTFFGDVADSQGMLFTCIGCSRATAVSGDEARDRWGREGRVAEIALRFRCRNCGRRGAAVEMIRGKVFISTREGERAFKKGREFDRFVRAIIELRPNRKIS